MTEQEIKLAREKYNKIVPYEKRENLKQMKNELERMKRVLIIIDMVKGFRVEGNMAIKDIPHIDEEIKKLICEIKEKVKENKSDIIHFTEHKTSAFEKTYNMKWNSSKQLYYQEVTGIGNFKTCTANNSKVTVTVKLIKTPIEPVTGTINVVLGAEAVLGD